MPFPRTAPAGPTSVPLVHLLHLVLLTLALWLAAAPARADIRYLDDFTSGSLPGFMAYSYFYENSVSGTGSYTGPAADVWGGIRELQYNFGPTLTSTNAIELITDDLGGWATENGWLVMNGAFRVNQLTLTYDGVAGSGAGLNANLSQAESLVVSDILVDHWNFAGTTTMILSLTDGFGVTRSQTLTVPNSTPTNTFVDLSFNLLASDFIGLNFSDIDRISFNYTGDHSQDGMFGGLYFTGPNLPPGGNDNGIPEPGTLALLLAGFAGLARRRAAARA